MKSQRVCFSWSALLALILNIMMKIMIKSPSDPMRAKACDMLKLSHGLDYNNPSFNTMFLAYTLAYTLFPQIAIQ